MNIQYISRLFLYLTTNLGNLCLLPPVRVYLDAIESDIMAIPPSRPDVDYDFSTVRQFGNGKTVLSVDEQIDNKRSFSNYSVT